MSEEPKYYHAFNLIPGVGPLKFKKIINHFESLEQAWRASSSEIMASGISPDFAQKICACRDRINPDLELQKLQVQNSNYPIQLLTIKDETYPALLKEIYDPPALLYVRGNINSQNYNISLGAIGTRKPSQYGRQVIFQMIGLLVQSHFSIISGLALGIDALAHQACINFNGHTVAVLGSGVNDSSIYPRTNFQLAQNILNRGGAVISEYPPGTNPLKQNFPYRNRIISGLSQGILVIEAGEKSGTLITARAALEQNREVFAIPGSIYNPNSKGTNYLIKIGAKVVTNLQDILEELNLKNINLTTKPEKVTSSDPDEALILKHLSSEPLYIDSVARKINFPSQKVSTILTMLEMKGMVRNVGGGNYVLS